MVLQGVQNLADASHALIPSKRRKISEEYTKHFHTYASVGTTQKNQWYIKSQLTFIGSYKVKKRFKMLVLHFVCARGEHKIHCYILL